MDESSEIITSTEAQSFSLDLDSEIQSSASGLTTGCNAVETGDTAAFTTTMIMVDDDIYPIGGKASWMPKELTNGDSTMEGIDSDGDCVRDDIERYIGRQFKSKADKRKRKYLFDYAKWLGVFSTPNWSITTSRTIANEQFRASECVRRIHGDTRETSDLLDNLFAKFHNTEARSFRYIDNDVKLGGWATRERVSVSCP